MFEIQTISNMILSSKPTSHKVSEMTKSFLEDHVTMLCNTFLKLLLQIATAMLIFAQ